jgi:DNA-binding response OmpR family regulator
MIHTMAHKALTLAVQPRPLQVLAHLANTPGPVSKWALVDRLQPGADDDGVLLTYISRLRDALGNDAIETIRGVGYQLTEKGRAAYAALRG